MKPSIRTFLDDLYEIDPALRQQEKDLIPLIEQLLAHDPAREPDAGFVEELRLKLQRTAHTLSQPRSATDGLSFSLMNKFLYIFAGATAAVVIVVPAVYYGTRDSNTSVTEGTNAVPLFSYSVTPAADNAFGSLERLQAADTSRGQGGGGGGGVPRASEVAPPLPSVPGLAEGTFQTDGVEQSATDAAPVDNGNAKIMADPMIYPAEWVEYSYQFSGALPALPEKTVSVLKRERGNLRLSPDSILRSLNLGNVNLQSFEDAKIDNISFSQDKQFGYTVGLQLQEGIVSISQNWLRWPHPEQQCRDEACYRQYRTKIGDIPADAELIRIANEFAEDHDIDLEHYGEPEVDNLWRRDYDRMPNKAEAYIPEMVQVLYPLIVEGRPVYDQGGMKSGIRISVSVRHKRVSDVWALQNQTYIRSNYEAISGSGDVLKYLEEFERMPRDYMPADAKVTKATVTLGTPTLGFATYYAYDKTPAEELIVPALIFPVENISNSQFLWRQNVIVPLAKELLAQPGYGGGPVMPLMERSAR